MRLGLSGEFGEGNGIGCFGGGGGEAEGWEGGVEVGCGVECGGEEGLEERIVGVGGAGGRKGACG